LFMIGRVLFSIGYVFGAGIGLQSLRLTGLGLTYGPIIIIFAEISGHSII
jgi:hypothetical protein